MTPTGEGVYPRRETEKDLEGVWSAGGGQVVSTVRVKKPRGTAEVGP